MADLEVAAESQSYADPTDLASAAEMIFNTGAVEAAKEQARQRVAPESHPDFDGKHCVDCDEPIPKKRLAMQRIRCVSCQERLEKANGHRRH